MECELRAIGFACDRGLCVDRDCVDMRDIKSRNWESSRNRQHTFNVVVPFKHSAESTCWPARYPSSLRARPSTRRKARQHALIPNLFRGFDAVAGFPTVAIWLAFTTVWRNRSAMSSLFRLDIPARSDIEKSELRLATLIFGRHKTIKREPWRS